MYVDCLFRFSPAHLDRLIWFASQLGLDAPGASGGSTFSDWKASWALLSPELLSEFPTLQKVCIVQLRPSAQIVAHIDQHEIYPNEQRYHVPLKTNEGCWVFSDGVWQQLEVGRLYKMDPTKPHGAVNWGTTVRWHLLMDVTR